MRFIPTSSPQHWMQYASCFCKPKLNPLAVNCGEGRSVGDIFLSGRFSSRSSYDLWLGSSHTWPVVLPASVQWVKEHHHGTSAAPSLSFHEAWRPPKMGDRPPRATDIPSHVRAGVQDTGTDR